MNAKDFTTTYMPLFSTRTALLINQINKIQADEVFIKLKTDKMQLVRDSRTASLAESSETTIFYDPLLEEGHFPKCAAVFTFNASHLKKQAIALADKCERYNPRVSVYAFASLWTNKLEHLAIEIEGRSAFIRCEV